MKNAKIYAMDLAGELVKASLSNHAHHASKDAGKRIAEMYEIVYRKIVEIMEENEPDMSTQTTVIPCSELSDSETEKGEFAITEKNGET